MGSKYAKGTRHMRMPPMCPPSPPTPDDPDPPEPPHDPGFFVQVRGVWRIAGYEIPVTIDEKLPEVSEGLDYLYQDPLAVPYELQWGRAVYEKDPSDLIYKCRLRVAIQKGPSSASEIFNQYVPFLTLPGHYGPYSVSQGETLGYTGTVEFLVFSAT